MRFLTGSLPEVQAVCRRFGLGFWQDDGLYTHSLHTFVIDRQGKLAADFEGNEFTAEQLGISCFRRCRDRGHRRFSPVMAPECRSCISPR